MTTDHGMPPPYSVAIIYADPIKVPSSRSSRNSSFNGSCKNQKLNSPRTLNKQIVDEHKTNYGQTLMHLLNGFIGSGILSMPITFKDGGLVVASIMNPLIGLLSCFCIHRLLATNKMIMNTIKCQPLEYHEVRKGEGIPCKLNFF